LLVDVLGRLRQQKRYPKAKVEVDGKIVDKVPEVPIIIEGHVYVRVCSVSEELGVKMVNFKSEAVWIDREYEHFEFPVGERRLLFRGIVEETTLAPLIVGDTVYFPLRFVAERLGFTVDWDARRRTVVIQSPQLL
jgi:hypothetical protein